MARRGAGMASTMAGKVALITGGSSGIGRSASLLFAREGARTRATDSRMRVVEAAYDELGSRFGEWMVKIDGEPLDRFLGRLVASLDEGVRWDAETSESLVRAAGLEVLVAEIIGVREPEVRV